MKTILPRVVIITLILAVFLGGGWYIETQRTKQRSVLSGYFEEQPIQAASRIGGHVKFIHVKEGEAVKEGEPLVELEANPAQAETAAKLAAIEQARQQLRELQNGVRPEEIQKQEAVVAEHEAMLARLRRGPLPEEIDQVKARVRSAEALYNKAMAGPRPQEIEQARAAEQAAGAKLAQAEHGLTSEERAQFKARLAAAVEQEDLAQKDAARSNTLLNDGALSRQENDRAQSALRQAMAKRKEQEEASKRAEEGTRPEEIEQARQSYRQAKAALELTIAGTRREDKVAAYADLTREREALKLIQRGSRSEDIQAEADRVAQTRAVLREMRAGSRKEQIAQAQAALKVVEANARSSESNLSDRIVRAPQNGVIERIPIAVGDLISPGTVVARMANTSDLWLRIYVPESKLSMVYVDAESSLRVDGIPEPIDAIVESISSQGEFTPANLQTPEERGKQVFSVRLRLKKPDKRIKAGLYATVLRIGKWTP